jgi:REP element-mobilizing transposase RayT
MPQSLSQLYVHLIFSTKHREPMLLSPARQDLHAYLAAILNNQDSPALKVGGMSDHVHALFRLSNNIALAKIVEEVKTSSSKWVKTQGRDLANFYWQSGYGAFSVSAAGVEEVVEYIAQQESHHRVVSFQEEFRKLLHAHGIAYDEQYVWD